MKIEELQTLRQYKARFKELQKIYFLKVKEIADLEEHLENLNSTIYELNKTSRAKLKNLKKIKI